mmetsp:Transcript_69733/g.110179  ORF Transcript_69733/g.110179 Transcript_69733/m.110179 type:complete len:122 (+) Transcript_69733:58-423(+)
MAAVTLSLVSSALLEPGLAEGRGTSIEDDLWMRQLERSLNRQTKTIAPPPKEPAPLFIEEALPPSMKVATPLVANNLNPFLPAKKHPRFEKEVGATTQFQFSWEPAVIRTSDLSAFKPLTA